MGGEKLCRVAYALAKKCEPGRTSPLVNGWLVPFSLHDYMGHRNKQDYDISASEVLYSHEAARNPSSRVTAAMGC
jgi:hypothetical protein